MLSVYQSIFEISERLRPFDLPQALGSIDFYKDLEKSQSLHADNGWTPQFAIYQNEGEDIGFTPLFEKSSSADDFSRDEKAGQDYEKKTGLPYYPKLQICIPFMPMHGTKFYMRKGFESYREAFVKEVLQWAHLQRKSSLHITFPEEHELLSNQTFFSSQHVLVYWKNREYENFDHFLGKLKSKYRSQIVGERKRFGQGGYETSFVTGDQIKSHHVDTFYDLFERTHDRKNWKMSYLKRDFFHRFSTSSCNQVVYFFIRKGNEAIASSCCFLDHDMFCGRFWGSTTDENFIHFEVMYYLPIEYCIENKISSMEMGFEQLHKLSRGFEPKCRKTFHLFEGPYDQSSIKKTLVQSEASTKKVFR